MQRANRDRTVCPCGARISAIFVLRAYAQIEALPKAGHARVQTRCVRSMGNGGLKEASIGKLSALLALDARPSTDEDTSSQLWFEQPEGMLVRNWRCSSGDPPFAAVGGPHRVEWRYSSDYSQKF